MIRNRQINGKACCWRACAQWFRTSVFLLAVSNSIALIVFAPVHVFADDEIGGVIPADMGAGKIEDAPPRAPFPTFRSRPGGEDPPPAVTPDPAGGSDPAGFGSSGDGPVSSPVSEPGGGSSFVPGETNIYHGIQALKDPPPDNLKKYDSKVSLDCENIEKNKDIPKIFEERAKAVCMDHQNEGLLSVQLREYKYNANGTIRNSFAKGCLGAYAIVYRHAVEFCRLSKIATYNRVPPSHKLVDDEVGQRGYFVKLAEKAMVDAHQLQRLGDQYRHFANNGGLDKLSDAHSGGSRMIIGDLVTSRMEQIASARKKEMDALSDSERNSDKPKEIRTHYMKAEMTLKIGSARLYADLKRILEVIGKVELYKFDVIGRKLQMQAADSLAAARETCGRAARVTDAGGDLAIASKSCAALDELTDEGNFFQYNFKEVRFDRRGIPAEYVDADGPDGGIPQRNMNDLYRLEKDFINMGAFGPDPDTRDDLLSWLEVDSSGRPVLTRDQLREKLMAATAYVQNDLSRGSMVLVEYKEKNAAGEEVTTRVWTTVGHVLDLEGKDEVKYSIFPAAYSDNPFGLDTTNMYTIAKELGITASGPNGEFTPAELEQIAKGTPRVALYTMRKGHTIYDENVPYTMATNGDFAVLDPRVVNLVGMDDSRLQAIEVRNPITDPYRKDEQFYCTGFAGELGKDLTVAPCTIEGQYTPTSVAIRRPNMIVNMGGSSGGAVVDAQGRLVCLNSWGNRMYSVDMGSDTQTAGCTPVYPHVSPGGGVKLRPYRPEPGTTGVPLDTANYDPNTRTYYEQCVREKQGKGAFLMSHYCTITFTDFGVSFGRKDIRTPAAAN